MKTYKQFQEGVAAAALKVGGSKVVPALMGGIGAAGMIMQSKKSKGPFADTGGFDASKSRTKRQYLGLPPSSGLTKQQKKNRKIKGQQEIIKRRDDKIATEGPGDLVPGAKRARLKKLLKGYLEKSGIKAKRDANKKIDRNLGKNVDEGVTALAVGGSKVVPALMTGIGAVGTIMQAKKKSKGDEKLREIARQQGLDLTDPRQRMKAMSRSRQKSMKGKVNNPKGPEEFYKRKKKKKDDIPEEAMTPTNNASSGAIAGLPPDNPPVKRKKRYIYGGTGSRKIWMNNK